MPAAAVIPAPIAYTNVVAVKKLVVGFLRVPAGRGLLVSLPRMVPLILRLRSIGIRFLIVQSARVYFEKIRVFKTVSRLYIIAWNNN